jgi:hypothetical protein
MLAPALVLIVATSALGASLEWCAEDCAGDGPDGSCALEACCSCCVHSRVDPPRATSVEPDPPLADSLPGHAGIVPASPDPRDILHVPKPARTSIH